MEKKMIKDLKKGEFFTLNPHEYPKENQVYIRDVYDRSLKRYLGIKWWDCLSNPRCFKGTKEVYVGFTF